MKRLFVGLLLALAPVSAQAVEGSYMGQWHEVNVRRAGAQYSVEITTWNGRGCGGGVTAQAATLRPTTLVRTRNAHPDLFGRYQFCDVLLRFRGRQLEIEEGDGCLEWHGAACGFTGTLTRQ